MNTFGRALLHTNRAARSINQTIPLANLSIYSISKTASQSNHHRASIHSALSSCLLPNYKFDPPRFMSQPHRDFRSSSLSHDAAGDHKEPSSSTNIPQNASSFFHSRDFSPQRRVPGSLGKLDFNARKSKDPRHRVLVRPDDFLEELGLLDPIDALSPLTTQTFAESGLADFEKALSMHGIVCIRLSMNNTFVTLTDVRGKILAQSTSGICGFKGPKRGQPAGATAAATVIAQKALALDIKTISIKYKGVGKGRDPAIKALRSFGLQVTTISDVTPIPHNGCRPRKPRRL